MDQKQVYEQKADAQLREIRARIEQLKAQAEQAQADQKLKYYEQIEDLQARQREVMTMLDQLREAGEGAWEEIRSGMEQAWKDLEDAVQRAGERFR